MKKDRKDHGIEKIYLSRRDFLKTAGLLAGGAMALGPGELLFGDDDAGGPDVWVVHGKDPEAMMKKCLEIIKENGGLGKKLDTMALKVNAAWARTPEEGATTHPKLVETFIKGSKEMGVKDVLVPENPCADAKVAFTKSGILDAVKRAGGKMIDLRNSPTYKKVEIPKGKVLKNAEVADEYLTADVIVNIPVAKNHSGAMTSIAMKNWMGAIKDRGWWHKNNLHQCIADFCTITRPDWTIIDATRVMVEKGPQGPGALIHPDLLVMSKDQVAADTYVVAEIFKNRIEVDAVKYLLCAREMNLGCTYLNKMKVRKVEA